MYRMARNFGREFILVDWRFSEQFANKILEAVEAHCYVKSNQKSKL